MNYLSSKGYQKGYFFTCIIVGYVLDVAEVEDKHSDVLIQRCPREGNSFVLQRRLLSK